MRGDPMSDSSFNSPATAHPWLHTGLMPALILSLVALVLLTLSRVLLIIWQHKSLPDGSLSYILLQGLRVDFATLCALMAPLFLTLSVLCLIRLSPAPVLWLCRVYAAAAITFLVMNEAATPGFILEYGVRPNHLYVQYLMYPREVFSTLWGGHKAALFSSLFLMALSACLSFRLVTYLLHPFILPSVKAGAAGLVALLAIVPLGIRSTLGHRPLNPAMVAFCDVPLANTLPLNSSYAAAYALAHLNSDRLSAGDIYKKADRNSVLAALNDFSVRESAVRENGTCPLTAALQPVHRGPMRNLVIILEESLGADFVKSLGGQPVTPSLEALKDQGWWFEHLYAAGHRSIRGIEAVMAGFPPSPLQSIVKLPQPRDRYATLATVLERRGYTTSFIYGGESHFDNMRSFFLNNGVQKVIDQDDYPHPSFVASWGVSDEDLFNRAHDEFSSLHQSGKPFFSLIFTSSFHDPFDIPEGKVSLDGLQTDEPERLLAAKYADYALGEYFKKAQSSDYYADTVFLVVADHESRVRGDGTFPLSKFSIPALILGRGIAPRSDPRVVSQIDLLPTLLSLIGYAGKIPFVGQDLNRADIKERAIMQFNSVFGYLKDGRFITLTPGKEPSYFDVDERNGLHTTAWFAGMEETAVALSNLGPTMYAEGWLSESCIREGQ